jgi:uncharacterized protein (UPF0332 family)
MAVCNLINKSEINYDSAKSLHDNGSYPSVPHCAYYSCFQFMSHIWLKKLQKSEAELKSLKKTNEGSHEVLINQIKIYLDSKSPENGRTFNNNILALRKLRTDSDYRDIEITRTPSENSITLSKDILKILKEC